MRVRRTCRNRTLGAVTRSWRNATGDSRGILQPDEGAAHFTLRAARSVRRPGRRRRPALDRRAGIARTPGLPPVDPAAPCVHIVFEPAGTGRVRHRRRADEPPARGRRRGRWRQVPAWRVLALLRAARDGADRPGGVVRRGPRPCRSRARGGRRRRRRADRTHRGVPRARRAAPDAGITTVVDAARTMREGPPDLRVTDVAARHGVSVRTLQRLFRRHVGVSPKWVLQRYRLHEAAERMAAGEATDLASLAQDLGYFDQAHSATTPSLRRRPRAPTPPGARVRSSAFRRARPAAAAPGIPGRTRWHVIRHRQRRPCTRRSHAELRHMRWLRVWRPSACWQVSHSETSNGLSGAAPTASTIVPPSMACASRCTAGESGLTKPGTATSKFRPSSLKRAEPAMTA